MSNLEKHERSGPLRSGRGVPRQQVLGDSSGLTDLVEAAIVRMIDLVFITEDAEGNVASLEVGAATEVAAVLERPAADATDLIDEEHPGCRDMLEPNSSVGLLVFENTWAARFTETLRNAMGKLLMNVRIRIRSWSRR